MCSSFEIPPDFSNVHTSGTGGTAASPELAHPVRTNTDLIGISKHQPVSSGITKYFSQLRVPSLMPSLSASAAPPANSPKTRSRTPRKSESKRRSAPSMLFDEFCCLDSGFQRFVRWSFYPDSITHQPSCPKRNPWVISDFRHYTT